MDEIITPITTILYVSLNEQQQQTHADQHYTTDAAKTGSGIGQERFICGVYSKNTSYM